MAGETERAEQRLARCRPADPREVTPRTPSSIRMTTADGSRVFVYKEARPY
jgi:hypothetical protein